MLFFTLRNFIYFYKDGEQTERNDSEERVGKIRENGVSGAALSRAVCLSLRLFVVCVCYL